MAPIVAGISQRTRYVVGFMFHDNAQQVILIRKNKPAWQAGKLNGVGGKVEGEELYIEAMVREFLEETGIETKNADWHCFCELIRQDSVVACFYSFNEKTLVPNTTTDEAVGSYNVSPLPASVIPNIPILIGLALHPEREIMYTRIDHQSIHERPKEETPADR